MLAGSVYMDYSKSVDWLKPYWFVTLAVTDNHSLNTYIGVFKTFHHMHAYRKVLMMWGDYIVASLPDPGNQLCTDDFEGPSPHNVNLAAKVIYNCVFYIGS